MGIGTGTMGLSFLLFVTFWITMMAAMMLPSVAPVATTWARAIGRQSSGLRRAARTAQFLAGYLLAWGGVGCLAYGGLVLLERVLTANPDAGPWIGAAAFAAAGLQQLGPLKEVCLRHCRSPFMQLLHYAQFRGPARDLRVGLDHGAYCVGCCWGLMVLLVPLGVMNVAAMAALAALIFLEKLWSRGPALARTHGRRVPRPRATSAVPTVAPAGDDVARHDADGGISPGVDRRSGGLALGLAAVAVREEGDA